MELSNDESNVVVQNPVEMLSDTALLLRAIANRTEQLFLLIFFIPIPTSQVWLEPGTHDIVNHGLRRTRWILKAQRRLPARPQVLLP